MPNISIWPIDKTLSGATTLSQSGPGSNGYEKEFHFPQTFETGASPSDGLCQIQDTIWGRDLTPLQRLQSVYSTAPVEWAKFSIGTYHVLPLVVRVNPGSDGNKGVLRITQSSSITGASPSDCLVSYQDTYWESPTPSADTQSVYSTKFSIV